MKNGSTSDTMFGDEATFHQISEITVSVKSVEHFQRIRVNKHP